MTRIEEDRLIQNERNLPVMRRTFWGVLTAVFWVTYVYLWLPLITLLMWYLGVRQARLELYLRTHSFDPYLLIVLPVIAILAAMTLVIWAEYNRNRFSGGDRRAETPVLAHSAIVNDLGGNADIATTLAGHKVCVLHMNEHAVPMAAVPVHVGRGHGGASEAYAQPLKYRHIERAEYEPASIQQSEPHRGAIRTRES